MFALAGRQAVILRVPNRAFRTRLDAFRAEKAPAQVQRQTVRQADRSGRTGGFANVAAFGALRRIDRRSSAKALRQYGQFQWEFRRPVTLGQPRFQDCQHDSTSPSLDNFVLNMTHEFLIDHVLRSSG